MTDRDRHVLVVVKCSLDLLEAAVQVADVRHGIHHPLAVQREQQAQRRMRRDDAAGRVQRPEIIRCVSWVSRPRTHPTSQVSAVKVVPFAPVPAADSLYATDALVNSGGSRILRRSGWPSKWMQTCQRPPAPASWRFHKAVTEGIVRSGSFQHRRATVTRNVHPYWHRADRTMANRSVAPR